MAQILKGAEVAEKIRQQLLEEILQLKQKQIEPCLAIVRLGAREDDLAYERGVMKRCEKVGIVVRQVLLPETATQEELLEKIHLLNQDTTVHGILMFYPLPAHIDGALVREAIAVDKDVDGMTDASGAALYSGKRGYPPCTAAACIALLHDYGIAIEGRRAVVVGRSLVVGKPAALLLLNENATVTVCHSHSHDLPAVCREADILIAAVGKKGLIGAEHVRAGQIVLDVGIHMTEQGICGDVRFEEVEPVVKAITPVPGGVGAVTNIILLEHVVEAAKRSQ